MSHVLTGAGSGQHQRTRHPSIRIGRLLSRLLALAVLAGGLGALAGVAWWWAVDLPGYTVGRDGRAATTERGLAEFLAGDAWFVLLGALVGLLLGWLAWSRLRPLGWPVVLVAVAAAELAALVCWLVGYQLGPGDFTRRLARAQPGDFVPIELTLRAKASLLVWPFAASVPVLLASSLGPDDEEPHALPRRLGRPSLRWPLKRRSSPPEPPSP